MAGCLIPDGSTVHAAPNGRRFIIRPTEHAAFHVKISSTKGQEAVTNVKTNKIVPDQNKQISTEASETHVSQSKQTSITLKHNHKMRLYHVGQMLDPKINLSDPSKDKLDVWSKKFCIKTIHTGVKKLVSNNTSLEFYDSVIEGVQEYHRTVLSDVEINNYKKLGLGALGLSEAKEQSDRVSALIIQNAKIQYSVEYFRF